MNGFVTMPAISPPPAMSADNDNIPQDHEITSIKLATATREFDRVAAEQAVKDLVLKSGPAGVKLLALDVKQVTPAGTAQESVMYSILYTVSGPTQKVLEFEKIFS